MLMAVIIDERHQNMFEFFYGAAWTTALLILFRTLNIHVFLRIIRNEQKY